MTPDASGCQATFSRPCWTTRTAHELFTRPDLTNFVDIAECAVPCVCFTHWQVTRLSFVRLGLTCVLYVLLGSVCLHASFVFDRAVDYDMSSEVDGATRSTLTRSPTPMTSRGATSSRICPVHYGAALLPVHRHGGVECRLVPSDPSEPALASSAQAQLVSQTLG